MCLGVCGKEWTLLEGSGRKHSNPLVPPLPPGAGVTQQAWAMLSIFLSTIMGLVLGPLPVGAWAFCGLTATVLTGTLPFNRAVAAMTNEVIWLIVISFFFAKGIEKTGLGERIANIFVQSMGKSTLGLAYGLAIAGKAGGKGGDRREGERMYKGVALQAGVKWG